MSFTGILSLHTILSNMGISSFIRLQNKKWSVNMFISWWHHLGPRSSNIILVHALPVNGREILWTWENVISYAPIVNRAIINKCTSWISTKEMILEWVLMNIMRILSHDIRKIVLSLAYWLYTYIVRARGVFAKCSCRVKSYI